MNSHSQLYTISGNHDYNSLVEEDCCDSTAVPSDFATTIFGASCKLKSQRGKKPRMSGMKPYMNIRNAVSLLITFIAILALVLASISFRNQQVLMEKSALTLKAYKIELDATKHSLKNVQKELQGIKKMMNLAKNDTLHRKKEHSIKRHQIKKDILSVRTEIQVLNQTWSSQQEKTKKNLQRNSNMTSNELHRAFEELTLIRSLVETSQNKSEEINKTHTTQIDDLSHYVINISAGIRNLQTQVKMVKVESTEHYQENKNNYQSLDKRINQTMKLTINLDENLTVTLKKGINETKSNLEKINKNIEDIEEWINNSNITSRSARESCFGGFVYGKHCIKLAYTLGRAVKFARAQKICENFNASLAEISSVPMYEKVYKYVATTWIQNSHSNQLFVEVWLGITFQPLNLSQNVITLRNGTEIELQEWFQGFPRTGPTFRQFNKMFMRIYLHSPRVQAGLRNGHPTNDEAVPLCSYLV